MNSTILRALATGLALAATTTGLAGDIYTWKDAEGHIHYSDVPPPGNTEVKKMRASSASTPATEAVPAAAAKPAAGKSLAEKDLEFRRRKAEAQEAKDKTAQDQAAAERRKQDCESARNQLRALESGQRMSRFNDKGEAIPLEDEQRQAEIERSRQYLDKNCK